MPELKQLSKKWKKGLTKFNPKLIHEVYQIVHEDEDHNISLGFLVETEYFENVLWEYFEEDNSTNEHIELIAELLVYDLTISAPSASRNLLDVFGSSQTEAYLRRVLTITSISSKSGTHNSSITSSCKIAIFRLLSVLISSYSSSRFVQNLINALFNLRIWKHLKDVESLLAKLPLSVQEKYEKESTNGLLFPSHPNWFYEVIIGHQRDDLDPNVKLAIENFLVVCLRQVSIRYSLVTFLKESGFDSSNEALRYYLFYPVDNFTGKVLIEDETVAEVAEKLTSERFYKLQQAVSIHKKDETSDWFTLLPSFHNLVDDVHKYDAIKYKAALEEFLKTFSDDILVKLANSTETGDHIPEDLSSDSRLVRALSNNIFPPTFDTRNYVHNELLKLDSVEGLLMTSSNSVPQTDQYLSLHDFAFTSFSRLTSSYVNSAVSHLDSVLNRLSISDDGTVNGKSKYSSVIRTINVESETVGINLSTDISFEVGDLVSLVTISSRNMYSRNKFEKEYGIAAIKTYPVVYSKQKFIRLTRKPTDEESSFSLFTHLIKQPNIPSMLNVLLKNDDFELGNFPEYVSVILLTKTVQTIPNNVKSTSKNIIEPPTLSKVYEVVEVQGFHETKRAKPNPKSHSGKIEFTRSIVESENKYLDFTNGLSVVESFPYCGESYLNSYLLALQGNFPSERILVVHPIHIPKGLECMERSINLTGDTAKDAEVIKSKLKQLADRSTSLFKKVDQITSMLNLSDFSYSQSYEDSKLLFQQYIVPKWRNYLSKVRENPETETVQREYPFTPKLEIEQTDTFKEVLQQVVDKYSEISSVFEELEILSPLSKLSNNFEAKSKYLVNTYCNVIHVTKDFIINDLSLRTSRAILQRGSPSIKSIILMGNHAYSELESLLPFCFSDPRCLSRVVIMGNAVTTRESLIYMAKNKATKYGTLEPLTNQVNEDIARIYKSQHEVIESAADELENSSSKFNPGFDKSVQFIESESPSNTSAVVNLEEAEYIVAIFQYMRLLHYKASSIGIVCSSQYQQHLIKEVLAAKCAVKSNYGSPSFVALTTDHIQHCDYILLSTHGSSSVKSDFVRAATVARLGLYVLSNLMAIPNGYRKQEKLKLRSGETYESTKRSKQAFAIENSGHMVEYINQLAKKSSKSS